MYASGLEQDLVPQIYSEQGKETHLQGRQLEECLGRKLAPFHDLTAASPRHAGGVMFIGRVRACSVL